MSTTSINAPPCPESDKRWSASQSVLIVVMGVSGTGKSTLGNALARELDFPYVEGDDLHPKANVDKMASGVPLTDEDREPWLELLRTVAEDIAFGGRVTLSCRSSDGGDVTTTPDSGSKSGESKGVVITCSALKKYYRDVLRGVVRPASSGLSTVPDQSSPAVMGDERVLLSTYFVWIDGTKEVLQDRMEKREGHFMKASMLDSQLRTLERPEGEEGVVIVPLAASTQEQVRIAVEGLIQLEMTAPKQR